MALRFVSAQKPSDYANNLFDLQAKIAELEAQLKPLKKEAEHLQNYLIRFAKGKSFGYDGPRYQMVARIQKHERMILDQEKVRKMLKSKTPYTESQWTTCKIDYQYKD